MGHTQATLARSWSQIRTKHTYNAVGEGVAHVTFCSKGARG